MKKIFLLLFIFLFVSFAYGQKYYADLELKLDDKGMLYFSGNTNYPDLKNGTSEYFTSKKGPYWLFNITTNEDFSDYYISVEFPKNTEINYIKTAGSFRITEIPNLKLITTGSNEPVEIVVQYVLLKNSVNLSPIVIFLAILFISFTLFLILMKRPKKSNFEKLKILKYTLTDNQKVILGILQQSKEPITQKQLQHRTNLPKATLSRNLELLKQKNIITKQSRGMVNVIFINDEFKK